MNIFEYYSNISIVVKVFPWGIILYDAFKWVSQGSRVRIFLGENSEYKDPKGRQLVWHVWRTARRTPDGFGCGTTEWTFAALSSSYFRTSSRVVHTLVSLVVVIVAALHEVLCLLSSRFCVICQVTPLLVLGSKCLRVLLSFTQMTRAGF